MSEFDFDLPKDSVDDDLYQPEQQSYPALSWHGQATQAAEPTGGFWAIEVDRVAAIQEDGGPRPYFSVKPMRYGKDPTNEPVDSYVTQCLRCCPVAVRERGIITDEYGRYHYYPKRHPRDQRVPGKYTSHIQVMVLVPGLTEPVVLGLKGKTKTVSWDNNKGGRYSVSEFPEGVWQRLTAYAKRASEQQGRDLPPLCMWWIDLVPVHMDGEPYYLDVGRGTYMNPFNVDLRTGNGFPETRFVGVDMLLHAQEVRRSIGLDWVAQWQEVQEAQGNGNGDGPLPTDVDDEIPF